MRNPLMASFDYQPALVAYELRGQFESYLDQAASVLARIDAGNDNRPAMADDFWFSSDDWRSIYRPYTVKDGILLIPVKGVLLHDLGYQFGSYATGYLYITKALERGLADPQVKGIALIVDSPGGHVAGNFDLVDKLFAARGAKPIRAYASESAYSAAYSIASAADSVTVTRTGGVGSIGVLTWHLDMSGAMDQAGYRMTLIYAGKHKVDGNPYEALPADVKQRIQARIDDTWSIFVSTVARNRSLDEQVIRDFEALTFTATEATSNGLADTIGSLEDAIAVFAADLSSDNEDTTMMTEDEKKAAAQAVTTARAEGKAEGVTEGTAAGRTAGVAEGSAAERTRINTILGSDEGKKRPVAALAAALDSDMSVDQATKFLAKLPDEKADAPAAAVAAKPGANFDAAMERGNPELHAPAGANQEGTGGEGTPSRAEAAFALAGKAAKAA
ncbi:MAG: S49 family peptidase [Devosia sp.]|nr:S49 family peptidase [Devosia sp.]